MAEQTVLSAFEPVLNALAPCVAQAEGGVRHHHIENEYEGGQDPYGAVWPQIPSLISFSRSAAPSPPSIFSLTMPLPSSTNMVGTETIP